MKRKKYQKSLTVKKAVNQEVRMLSQRTNRRQKESHSKRGWSHNRKRWSILEKMRKLCQRKVIKPVQRCLQKPLLYS